MLSIQDRYDNIPYDSLPSAPSHIELLAVEARIAGLEAALPTRCRVLELGCASGGNLLPMADEFPDSEFVGIDLSPVQIAQGVEVAKAAGLANVQLLAMDLMEAGEELGKFDYVIAHGLYSWVPPAVQQKVLNLYKERLNPDGVGYISYNLMPGWQHHRMLREMLLLHTRGMKDIRQIEQRARELLNALAADEADAGYRMAGLLAIEARVELSRGPHHFMHDLLAEFNEPIWFETFIDRLAEHGLAYLADSRPRPSRSALAGRVWAQFPDAVGDRLKTEQYLDLLTVSQFRRSMVVHADRPLAPTVDLSWAERFTARAVVRPVKPPIDPQQGEEVEFTTHDGGILTLDDTLTKLVLAAVCSASPSAIEIEKVLSSVLQWTNAPRDSAAPGTERRAHVADVLLRLRASGAVEMRWPGDRFVRHVSARPTASPLARVMAALAGWAPSRLHAAISLSAVDRVIVPAGDGTNTTADFERAVEAAMQSGHLPRPADAGAPEAGVLKTTSATVAASLARLAGQALLIG